MTVRLLVYVPTFASMARPETLESVGGLCFADGVFDVEIADGKELFAVTDKADNLMAQQRRAWAMTKEGAYDALVFIEHDMIVPSDALTVLWRADKPVVYAPYLFRHGGFGLSTLAYNGNRNVGSSITDRHGELSRAFQAGYYRVSGTGWGCTLIRREVTERIELRETSPKNRFTDIGFSEDCLRAGIEMCGAFQIPCLHYSEDEGLWLDPLKHNGGIVTKVIALRTINLGMPGGVLRMVEGKEYEMEQSKALHHAAVGDVRLAEAPEAPEKPAKAVKTATRSKRTTTKAKGA